MSEAEGRIRPWVRETPVEDAPDLGGAGGAPVALKLENLQHTGSFKVRGAMNKLLSLDEDRRRHGVVAASTGNHGAAVAWGLGRLGLRGLIFVPRGASAGKVAKIRELGAEVRHHGEDPAETERVARRFARERGMTYVSPYNDPQIVGCSPVNSAVMIRSVQAGRNLDLPTLPTLSDGTAGGLEPGAITFDPCRTLVDEFVTVTEDEIARVLRLHPQAGGAPIEGAAAVALASYEKTARRHAGEVVVIVLCGGNIDPGTLRRPDRD